MARLEFQRARLEFQNASLELQKARLEFLGGQAGVPKTALEI